MNISVTIQEFCVCDLNILLEGSLSKNSDLNRSWFSFDDKKRVTFGVFLGTNFYTIPSI